ncbi:ladderlectin-like [Danio aesculapii]|uniref:ladderlectin-like n=1 Tax=Danio aesculapii TaxID=1142201 RepID=UPI0024C0C56B|nr:ladderlectin-like [Danio aesculapii]
MWISAAFLLFALAVNGVNSDVPNISRRCPAGWEKFGSQCFKFFNEYKTWAEAEKQCVDLGGNLASIQSEVTHNFLLAYLKRQEKGITRTWIGAHDATQVDIWFWSDGSKFEYSAWHSGEPNNGGNAERCAEMGFGDELRWNDARCETRLNFICYRSARITM